MTAGVTFHAAGRLARMLVILVLLAGLTAGCTGAAPARVSSGGRPTMRPLSAATRNKHATPIKYAYLWSAAAVSDRDVWVVGSVATGNGNVSGQWATPETTNPSSRTGTAGAGRGPACRTSRASSG